MEINYTTLGIGLLLIILLIIFLIRRNQKDEKKFEKEMNSQKPIPKKHQEGEDKI